MPCSAYLKNVAAGLAASIIVFILLYPTFSTDYSDRSEILKAIDDQRDLKRYIEDEFKTKTQIDAQVIKKSPEAYMVNVTSLGAIHIYHRKTKTNIYLDRGILPDGSYGWTCRGDKPKNLPIYCK
jgi:hypothetical protein